MREIVRKTNAAFINIALVAIYVLLIGLSKVLRRLIHRPLKIHDTFWQNPTPTEANLNSSY